jgi:hypothetical protein
MKILKTILKWLGILLLLLIIFIVAAPFIFKGKIIAFVKEEVNNTLNAKVDFGEFDITLLSSFPNFTLSVDKVSVANVGDFAGDTLFSVKNLTATVDLMSVVKGEQYKIRSVTLDSPRIKAECLANGKTNWDITKPSPAATPSAPAPATKFKMSLKKLEIKNAHIIYDDASLGVYSLLDGFNYTMSGDFTQDNFEMQNDGTIDQLTVKYGGMAYMNKLKAKISAAIDADMPNFKFTFKKNEISLNELSLGVNGTFAMPKDDMDMDMQFKANQTEFKNILSLVPAVYTKDFSTVKTAGKFSLDAYVKGIYNDKKMPAFGANIKIEDAMFQYPSLPKAVNDIGIDVSVKNADGEPDHTITDIKKFHMEMAGNPVDIAMHIETPVSDPNIAGTIVGKINLASVKDIVPMEGSDLNGNITADVKMKGRMSSIEKEKYDEFDLAGKITVADMNYKSKDITYPVNIKSMTLNFSPQFVKLEGFDSKIGRSDIQAHGAIENIMQYYFKDSLLQGTFSMQSSLMDLNEFMASSTPTTTATPDTSHLSIIVVPKNIDFILNSTISKLLYDTYEIKDLAGSIIVHDSKVTMNKVKMNMMGGSMLMNGTYSTQNPKVPVVDFDMAINDFDIPTTFKCLNTVQKLAPIAKYATGKFSTQLKYVSNLDATMMPDMKTMNGDGRLQTKSVSVAGFEPLNKLADALGGMDKFKKAEFSNLDISYHIKDGKVSTDEFPFKSGSIAGNIFGSTALDQTIDYTMKMEIPTADMPAGAKAFVTKQFSAVNKLAGSNIKLPEKVKFDALFGGTVLKPTVKANMRDAGGNVKEAVKEVVKEKVTEKINEVKEDVSKKIEAQKQKILADAQAQADKVRAEGKSLAEQTKKTGYEQATNLEKQASNPIQKIAAKKAAEKLRKETDEKAKNIESEGNQKADGIMKAAQEQADKLK